MGVSAKIILVFTESRQKSVRQCLAGVAHYAHRHGFRLAIVGCGNGYGGRIRRVRDYVSIWHPVGAIVLDCNPPRALAAREFGNVPVVYVDSAPDSRYVGKHRVVCDSREIGRLAAKEFLRLGFRNFAYVPFPRDYLWCRSRGDAFVEAVGRAGHPCARIGGTRRDWTEDSPEWHRCLVESLRLLPRPCAVFAANDLVAMHVMNACAIAGILVPADVAVLGVDNDDAIALSTEPPLSSVVPDFQHAGYRAAEMVGRLIRDPGLGFAAEAFSAREIIRRGSTRRVEWKEPQVSAAVEMLSRRAADGLRVDDVVRFMGCSRRLAELRFREATGTGIHEAIVSARLALARTLLAEGRGSIPSIADSCGFGSVDAFRRAFLNEQGETPLAWRNALRM